MQFLNQEKEAMELPSVRPALRVALLSGVRRRATLDGQIPSLNFQPVKAK
jgi:hypothetical protein